MDNPDLPLGLFAEYSQSESCYMGPGWVLVRIVKQSDVKIVDYQMRDKNDYMRTQYKPVRYHKITYIFGRTKEEAVTALTKRLDDERAQHQKEIVEMCASLKEKSERIEKLERAATDIESMTTSRNLYKGIAEKSEKRCSSMEADIARIRTYIGEAKMKEIIGG